MDQTQQSTTFSSVKWRPVLLVIAMLAAAFLGALATAHGIALIGALLFPIMGGIFTVIFLTAKHPAAMVIGASGSVMLLQLFGGFSASLTGVIYLIASLVIAHQVRQRTPKTTVMMTVSVILGAGTILVMALFYALDGGSLVPADLLDAYHAFFKSLKGEFSIAVRSWVESMDEKTLALYAQMEITKELLIETYQKSVEAALDVVQLLLPGMTICSFQILAYVEISAFRISARMTRVDALLPSPQWNLVPTQVSCVVYLAVSVLYVITSFFASMDSIFMIVLVNLWLSLLPTMLFCGLRVFFFRLRHPMYRMGSGLILAVFIFGLFFMPSVVLLLAPFMLSFLGAQTISTMHAIESEKNKKQ
jgi:hypothetical protein